MQTTWLGIFYCTVTVASCSSVISDVEVEEVVLLQLGRQVISRLWPKSRLYEGTSALNAPLSLINETVATDKGASSALSIRPGFAAGTVDKVQFGIFIKNWYGIDLPGNTFSVDAVLTLQWFDPRTSKLLPPHSTSITLSGEKARSLMWLPDIVVTNADIGGRQDVSESIFLSSSGEVTRVQRTLLMLKQEFDTLDFPFDTQNVSVVLASATYMQDELQLLPMSGNRSNTSRASAHDFHCSVWALIGTQEWSVIDDDGALRKSRGVLTLEVQRNRREYLSEIFIPSALFLIMTWSALWLPLGGSYVMPRVAISAFALLCQVSISRGSNQLVPATGRPAWLFAYLELCTELQFVVMLITIIIIRAEQSEAGLGENLDRVMLVSYPITTLINIAVLGFGFRGFSRFLFMATILGYVAYLSFRLLRSRGNKSENER